MNTFPERLLNATSLISIVCALFILSIERAIALPVFPTAEGFGTTTIAGRGGAICKVINLNDSGPGSFRGCVEQAGPRIVIFKTGGTIMLQSTISILNPFISIFGQTAPGDGIMITVVPDVISAPVIVSTHDVLIQHLRFRPGTGTFPTCCRDGLSIHNSNSGNVYNVVIDHNSISWGTDGILDVWYDTNNITLSNNIIGQSMFNDSNDSGPAGRGLLFGSVGAHSISMHHNYVVHSYQRNPNVSVQGTTETMPVDIVNNIIYNWALASTEIQPRNAQDQHVNIVNNLYKMGLESSNFRVEIFVGDTDHAHLYIDGNEALRNPSKPVALTQADLVGSLWDSTGQHPFGDESDPIYQQITVDALFSAPAITTSAANTLPGTLLPRIGANLPLRDDIDTQLVQDFYDGTGKMLRCVTANDPGIDPLVCAVSNNGGWPIYDSGTPFQDTDGDGMSDAWEISRGLNTSIDDSALDIDGDGYSNIEGYVFSEDNDDDGLSDSVERSIQTDPDNPDTDGDGLNDSNDPMPTIFNFNDGDLAPYGAPDGVVNVADLLIATRIVLGLNLTGAIQLAHGDVYPPDVPDGKINLQDLILILKLIQ